MSLDKKTFLEMLGKGQTKAPKARRADWDEKYAVALTSKGIFTTTEFWESIVKKEVNRYRTKEVLHQWSEEKKVARIYKNGQYYWCFDPEVLAVLRKQ